MSFPHIKTIVVILLIAVSPVAARGEPGNISASDLSARLDRDGAPLVLDVRTKREYQAGHIPGALLIPYDELPSRLDELPVGRQGEVVVYCETGMRAAVAAGVLKEAGFLQVKNLEGHMRNWRGAGYPLK